MYGKPCKCDWMAKVIFLIQMLLTFSGCWNRHFLVLRYTAENYHSPTPLVREDGLSRCEWQLFLFALVQRRGGGEDDRSLSCVQNGIGTKTSNLILHKMKPTDLNECLKETRLNVHFHTRSWLLTSWMEN